MDRATGEEAELVCNDETFWLEADIPEVNAQFLAPLEDEPPAAGAPAQEEDLEEFPFDPDGRPEQQESSQQQPRSLESEKQDVEMIPVPAVDTQPIVGPA